MYPEKGWFWIKSGAKDNSSHLTTSSKSFMMNSLVALLVLLGLAGVTESFPDGAPKYQCPDAFPRHGFDAKPVSDVLPYEITASREVYAPEQEIDIKIEGKTIEGVKQKFRGFHIRVARVGYDYEQAVGYFKEYPETARGQDWYPQPEYPKDAPNCVTHRDSRERDEVTVTWKAPKQKMGDIDIKITIVKNFEEFWVDQTIRIESIPIEIPTDLRYEIEDTLHVPNFDTCGEDRGCLLYPRDCNGLGCRVAVSWRPDPNFPLWTLFDVMAETDGFVSVGLSEDKKMGDDATVTCMEKDGVFDIQYGFNTPDRDNDRHRTTELTDIQVARVGDKVFCRYRQRQADTFYYEDPETAARPPYSHRFTMSTPQHVLVAEGTVRLADSNCRDGPVSWRLLNKKKATGHVRHTASNTEQKCRQRCYDLGPAGCYGFDWRNSGKQCWINTKVSNYNNIRNDNNFKLYFRHNNLCGKRSMTIEKHEQHPLMSDSATLIQEDTDILTASSMPMLIKVHATLGILAWLTMAALSIILARHYRFVLSCLCCDRGCWFVTHATFMIVVVFLTVAAVIIQVALLGRWTEHGTAHAVLGLILTVFVIVQTVVGFCRPDPESDNRSIFNWIHRISGFALFILAAVTVLLGVNVSSLDDGFRSSQTVVVVVWLAFIVLWEILLEILSCCAKSSGTMGKESNQKYQEKSEKASQISGEDDEDELGGRRMTSVLFGFALTIYVFVTLAFFVWSLLNLFRFY